MYSRIECVPEEMDAFQKGALRYIYENNLGKVLDTLLFPPLTV